MSLSLGDGVSDTPIAVRALIPYVAYLDKQGVAHWDVAGEMLARYANLIEESEKQAARIRELEHQLETAAQLRRSDISVMGKLEDKITTQEEALAAVRGIILGSTGVYGWHLNGEPAPWREFDLPETLLDFPPDKEKS